MTTKISLFDVVKFKQYEEATEYRYLLINKKVEIGDYVYIKENGYFTAIQRVLHHAQLDYDYPIVEKTNNPNYEAIYNKEF